jgi:hypothetical protein
MDPVTLFNAYPYVFCALLRVWSVAKVTKIAIFPACRSIRFRVSSLHAFVYMLPKVYSL